MLDVTLEQWLSWTGLPEEAYKEWQTLPIEDQIWALEGLTDPESDAHLDMQFLLVVKDNSNE